jgi:hypothetical protein
MAFPREIKSASFGLRITTSLIESDKSNQIDALALLLTNL